MYVCLFFSESTCDVYGTKLREQVEERLKCYETGDSPRQNLEVMKEAITAVLVLQLYI